VSAPHEGIIALDVLRGQGKLVGLTFPNGNLVIYDLATRRSTIYPCPVTGKTNVSRKIFTSDGGKVYFSYQNIRDLWELDTLTGSMRSTGYPLNMGILQQTKRTADGRRIYLLDESSGLYVFDFTTGVLTDLGALAPGTVDAVLILSHDEKKLFTAPSSPDIQLVEYDVASRTTTNRGNFDQHLGVGGGALDAQGRFYIGAHNYRLNGARLLQWSGVRGSPPR
jgi:hypothetical protein